MAALEGVLDLAAEVRTTVNRVDRALPSLRALLEAAGADYKLVGGVAVVHHGYVRTTQDVDVLLERAATDRLDPLLADFGFERLSRSRLRHHETGVVVDLLLEGDPMPRPGSPPYPSPSALAGSPGDILPSSASQVSSSSSSVPPATRIWQTWWPSSSGSMKGTTCA